VLDDVKSQDDVEPGVHQRKLFCISLDDKRLRKATPGLLQQLDTSKNLLARSSGS
jgi:hypothetical protein